MISYVYIFFPERCIKYIRICNLRWFGISEIFVWRERRLFLWKIFDAFSLKKVLPTNVTHYDKNICFSLNSLKLILFFSCIHYLNSTLMLRTVLINHDKTKGNDCNNLLKTTSYSLILFYFASASL